MTARSVRPPHSSPDPAPGPDVAAGALRTVRLIAAGLVLLAAAGARPPSGAATTMALAVGAAVLLTSVNLLAGPGRAAGVRRPLVAAGCDAAVVVGVVQVTGLPPRSLTIALLLLPLTEAAVWAGLVGLAVAWVACTVALVGATVVTGGPQAAHDAGVLLVTMPVLALTTIPLAVLAEHLVAEVHRLHEAQGVAHDRAELLARLAAVTSGLFAPDLYALAPRLVSGAVHLGAAGAVLVRLGARSSGSDPVAQAGEDVQAAVVAGSDGVRVVAWRLPLLEGDAWELRATVRGSGEDAERRLDAIALLAEQGRAAVAAAAVVDELEELRGELERTASADPLTGLLNRRGLVARANALAGPLGVLFCDLDGFKPVNDTHGHAVGDDVLRQVARRLRGALPAQALIARLGGDEFVVVLQGEDHGDAHALAARLEEVVRQPFPLPSGAVSVGVSIGVVATGGEGHGFSEVLRRADEQMYAVKRERRQLPR